EFIPYSRCNNKVNEITMEEWDVDPPSMYINFIEENGKNSLQCYDDSLHEWLRNTDNAFALWVPHDPNKGMDESGRGGGPNPHHLFVKLYTGQYLVKDALVTRLANEKDIEFDAVYVGVKRIGNLQGIIGISMEHGQDPGRKIYRLKNPRKVKSTKKPID